MKLSCKYYQCKVVKDKVWYLTAIIRSFEHLCFDRTIDKQESILEFFVPEDGEKTFLEVISQLSEEGIVSDFSEKDNRLVSA